MNNKTILNKVRELLGMEVALEQMLMADGVTKIEADAFEGGNEVFVVTEDEQKIAVPVGEYELEDGRILVIVEEGIISEIKEVKEEEEMPEAPAQEVPEEATTPEMSAPVAPKKTIESIVKETFFSEIENLKKENEALKAELAKLSKVNEVADEKTELSEEVAPIVFNPENEMPTNHVKIGSKAPKGIMSSVLDKMYK